MIEWLKTLILCPTVFPMNTRPQPLREGTIIKCFLCGTWLWLKLWRKVFWISNGRCFRQWVQSCSIWWYASISFRRVNVLLGRWTSSRFDPSSGTEEISGRTRQINDPASPQRTRTEDKIQINFCGNLAGFPKGMRCQKRRITYQRGDIG